MKDRFEEGSGMFYINVLYNRLYAVLTPETFRGRFCGFALYRADWCGNHVLWAWDTSLPSRKFIKFS
jgi:hypothetical protein